LLTTKLFIISFLKQIKSFPEVWPMPSSCCSPWPARPSCEKEPGITSGPDGSIIGEADSVAAVKKAKVFWSKTFLLHSWKEKKRRRKRRSYR